MKRTILLAFLSLGTGLAMAAHWLPPAKYATEYTLYFEVYDSNSPWRVYATAPAAADVHAFQDGASEARATNAVTDIGRTFSLVLTATEMTAKVVTVDVNDATDPPLFGDEVFYIPTFGNASAYHVFDLSSATVTPGSGSITSTVVAAGAIDADALATDAATEISGNLLATKVLGNTAIVRNSVADLLRRAAGTAPLEISGTATGGAASTVVLAVGSSATNDAYIPCTVTLLDGTGSPAIRPGLSYAGSTRTLTIAGTWPGSSPDGTTVYKISIPVTSSLALEGLAQSGVSNRIVLASGDVTADDMTGFIQLVSGTGSATTVYTVTDSVDANDTLHISGTWAGDSPDSTTYYRFVPNGSWAADTYNYSYLTEIYETTNNAYDYVTEVNDTLNEFYTYVTEVNDTYITEVNDTLNEFYTYVTEVNDTYISNTYSYLTDVNDTYISNTYSYLTDVNETYITNIFNDTNDIATGNIDLIVDANDLLDAVITGHTTTENSLGQIWWETWKRWIRP